MSKKAVLCDNPHKNKLVPDLRTPFLEFADDKPSKKGVRCQKHREVITYNGEPYTVTFERGDKLN
jgi:hypothetical protein